MIYKAIVIGTSSGGLNALRKILMPLPADFSLPLLIVQHRAPAAEDHMIFPLNADCRLTVKEAEDKDVVKPGFVFVAPPNYHLLVEPGKTLSLSVDAKVRYARPAIDVLFETAADAFGANLIGIILTGANDDGTDGLRKIKENGGLTIVQDPTTAEVDLMPRAAIEANVVDKILSLAAISSFLIELAD